MTKRVDPYEVLGVDEHASPDVIHSAYRRLARLHHPDRYAHASPEEQEAAAARMRAINAAWELLNSPQRRREYTAARPDPMRLLNIESVLGPGFALKLWSSGGMTSAAWGGDRMNPFNPRPWGGLKGRQWFITTWARDLSPLRKLTPEEIPGLWVVNGHETGDEGMEHIAAMPWLEVLDLRDTGVTDAGIAKLRGFAKLWALNLNGTQITDRAVETLGTLTSLEELALAETTITDACVPALLQLTKLRLLNLALTKVSTSMIATLAQLPNLRVLNVPGRVPLRTLLWAKRHYPSLAIS